MKRCGTIELFRFIAAMSIAIFHFEGVCMGGASIYLPHNYIWVEFYFVLSGFFLAKNALNSEENDTWNYVISQFKKLYPLYVLAFIACFLFSNLKANVSPIYMLINLWGAKWEVLLCYIFSGIAPYNGGGAPAYIPILLICSLFIHFLIRKHKDLFLCIIVPLSMIMGLGYIFNTYGHVSVWLSTGEVVPPGLIRGFAEMSYGAFCWIVLMPYIEKISKVAKALILLFCVISCYALIAWSGYISARDLALWIFFFGLLIMVGYVIKLPKCLNDVFCFLGKLNYPIFLFHFVIFQIVNVILINETRYAVRLLFAVGLLLGVVVIINFSQGYFVKIKRGLQNEK